MLLMFIVQWFFIYNLGYIKYNISYLKQIQIQVDYLRTILYLIDIIEKLYLLKSKSWQFCEWIKIEKYTKKIVIKK